MSVTYINAELRRRVIARADELCEYCLIRARELIPDCEVDHIVSEKHDGATHEDNLAYACFLCNRYKGSDVGSFVPGTNTLVRFYNPRTDQWADHFAFAGDNITILSQSEIGEVTARIFNFNHPNRLSERQELQASGLYPSAAALRRIAGQT